MSIYAKHLKYNYKFIQELDMCPVGARMTRKVVGQWRQIICKSWYYLKMNLHS